MIVQVNATYLQTSQKSHYVASSKGYYAKYIIKGEKDIKKNHDYTILRQVFDMAREGGDDWVEDRFYKGKKIEQVEVGRLGRLGRVARPIRLGIRTSSPT